VRLWLWTAFAHGAEFVTTYRLRQARFGIELFHTGLLGTDGTTQTIGGKEFVQTIDEMQRLDASKLKAKQPEEFNPATTVGLLFDFEQLWYFQTLPQAKRWNQPQWLRAWYAACARNGLRVKILRPDAPWPAGLKMLIVPGLQMVDDPLVWRLTDYARSGGHLVLTCRTGLMDRNGQLLEGPTAAPILPLIAGTIHAYDSLPDGKFGEVEMDGKKYKWGTWGDQLVNVPAAHVVAKYADQFYAGAAAVTQQRHELGTVTYCGVCSEAPFVEALIDKIAPMAGLTVAKLPWRVQILRRGPYSILLNYGEQPVDAPAPKAARFIVGTRKTPAAGVAVWTVGP
jgi:beta-galactosidase